MSRAAFLITLLCATPARADTDMYIRFDSARCIDGYHVENGKAQARFNIFDTAENNRGIAFTIWGNGTCEEFRKRIKGESDQPVAAACDPNKGKCS